VSSTTSTTRLHVAVTVDDDRDRGAMLAHGRYLYFHPDEIRPLRVGRRSRSRSS
jgi:hypothetical protein